MCFDASSGAVSHGRLSSGSSSPSWRADHLTAAFVVFYVAFALLTAQAIGMVFLLARRVRLSEHSVSATTTLREVGIEWESVTIEAR